MSVTHISGHNSNSLENEASVLSNPNYSMFNECGGKSGGAAVGFPCRVSARVRQTRCEVMLPTSEAEISVSSAQTHSGSFIIPASLFTPDRTGENNTHLTPAEKLTTGKKSPSVLKFSNMPWTGWPLILNEMLGAPRSRQQLTTSSDVKMCWFRDATARGTRPR